ncbi:tetratricopeptide repeat protein, partial [Kaarinaea lacus]
GQDRTTDATETFYKFIERYPDHRQSPFFMVKLIDIFKHSGRKMDLLRAKADLVTVYGVGTPFWKRNDDKTKERLRPHVKQHLEDLTRYYHAEAQTKKSVKDYRVAAHWYRTYVRSFPKDPSTPEKNMLLAESLQDSGDIEAAATEFENTAYAYPKHKQSAEAGYAALLAHRKLIGALEGKAQNKKRLYAIANGKRFVSYFPDDKRSLAVMSKAAEELMSLKDYQQAVNTAHYVVSTHPAPDRTLLRNNWAIIAEGEFAMAAYPEAEYASQKRLALATENDSEKNKFSERLAAAIYKQGELARERNDHREAARHFLRLGKVVPDAKIRVNADFDAAASLVTLQDWKLAIPVLKSFVQRYPDHKLRSGADQSLALAYEKTNDWENAAGAYAVLYENEKDTNKKRLILWQTAEFYKKANRTDKLIETYKQYVNEFPMPFNEAIEVRHNLATIYKEQGKTESRHYWLSKIVAADKEGPSTERSKYLAATAMLELASPTYQAYRSVHLVQPLKKNLKKKKELMQDSIDAYTEAADYGIEGVTTASTYRIAEIYSDFSRGLFASERPKGLSEDEKEQYEILLEEQAFPFEEKAIEIHEVNALRVTAGVYDRWVKESFAALTKLNPVRYAKDEVGVMVNDEIQ